MGREGGREGGAGTYHEEAARAMLGVDLGDVDTGGGGFQELLHLHLALGLVQEVQLWGGREGGREEGGEERTGRRGKGGEAGGEDEAAHLQRSPWRRPGESEGGREGGREGERGKLLRADGNVLTQTSLPPSLPPSLLPSLPLPLPAAAPCSPSSGP